MTTANKNTLIHFGIMVAIFCTLMGVSVAFQNFVMNMAWFFGAIMFCIFALDEGYNEAKSDHFKSLTNIIDNNHVMYRIGTSVVLILLHQFVDWKSLLCYVGMYMFLHDGIYYSTRHAFNNAVYTKGWFAFTDTPIAITDKLYIAHPVVRTVLFFSSALALIIINYVNR